MLIVSRGTGRLAQLRLILEDITNWRCRQRTVNPRGITMGITITNCTHDNTSEKKTKHSWPRRSVSLGFCRSQLIIYVLSMFDKNKIAFAKLHSSQSIGINDFYWTPENRGTWSIRNKQVRMVTLNTCVVLSTAWEFNSYCIVSPVGLLL